MNLSKDFVQALTGCDMGGVTALKQAVALRAERLIPTLTRRTGDYIYSGNRCRPENLGWRTLQNIQGSHVPAMPGGCFGPAELYGKKLPAPTVETITSGEFDLAIEATWHDAARAEHWYCYEKNWGD